MKFKIRCFCLKYAKKVSRLKKEKLSKLENILNKYETTQKGIETCSEYLSAKFEYESLLNEKTEGTILRSKTVVYEQNEKSSKYFLNLEKRNSSNNTIKILVDEESTSDKN